MLVVLFRQQASASPDRKFDRPDRNRSCSPELSRTPADAGSKRRKLDDKVFCLSVCLSVVTSNTLVQ